ncbi:bifunctional metallophosphatase/5'-nucleotidase [filamentous cyanobacterium LEGE 11480]|uniref:Bifunctional metallophosphatase/5'-nucleotidase n=1 Tax=Romeriopsis navalis LEGE 11480 TaxID=2777977 RepID=A0A928Z2C4_9CYAN|nr:bifunctional metallophosphatase/5'-nucleotidase [Romeriopsis navalis]MBE9030256.1 bifunctional metallophosphatase/5'-nucleotidase [Romeriopsis navalis LEGE 11480]
MPLSSFSHRCLTAPLTGLLSTVLVLGLSTVAAAEIVKINLLQLNDVYEITPVQEGQRGGLARVATLRNQLVRENPRTYTILGGDFLSPSALGTAKVDGERLAGRQMVDVLNFLGLDYATFGNHEFDIAESLFRKRLAESKFQWISSNVSQVNGKPFEQVARSKIITARGLQGATVKIGLIGVTLPSNPAVYVRYQNYLTAARREIQRLEPQVDVLVAITHLTIDQDRQMAATFPEIDLILGGHEHENIQQWRFVNRFPATAKCQQNQTPIFKADANATTVYVHRLQFDTTTRCLAIKSELQLITAALSADQRTDRAVQNWVKQGFEGFRREGFAPEQRVATITQPLDGTEASIRNQPTGLSNLIAQAMLRSASNAELAIFNSGSVRIDDVLPPGAVTQYDVIRVLPFGGKVLTIGLQGAVLQRLLDAGLKSRGTGAYLQHANVAKAPSGDWLIQQQPLMPQRIYRVAVNDFLVSGNEQNLEFFKLGQPGIELLQTGEDIRFALIRQLQTVN